MTMTPNEIADIRERAGLTMEQLGRVLGVGRSTVSEWEHGTNQPTQQNQVALERIRERLDRADDREEIRDLLLKIGGVAATAGLLAAWKQLFSDETDTE